MPAKSHMNLTAKALDRIEDGSDLRPPMVERYLELIGHSATVMLKQAGTNRGEIPLGKLSEASVLAVKASSLANRDVARQLGKNENYFSMKESSPSLEFALEIFEFLGYSLGFRLYSHGITEEMATNLKIKREKLGLKGAGSQPQATPQQLKAQSAFDSLFLEG